MGAIGFAAFFMLRPGVDFNSGAPIPSSKTDVEVRTAELAGRLGFSVDSLNMLTSRSQHLNHYRILKDSLGPDLPGPWRLNKTGAYLSSWVTMIGTELEDKDAFGIGGENVFDLAGKMQFRYDRDGNVRRIRTNPLKQNPSFVAGDSLYAIAGRIAGDILGYQLENYRLRNIAVEDTVVSPAEPGFENRPLNVTDTSVGNNTVFNWVKSNPQHAGPATISLEVKPIIRELETDYGVQVRFGASIVDFKALDAGEPVLLERPFELNSAAFLIFFIVVGILTGLVFYEGIRNINQGHVEWRKALFVMGAIFLGIFGWRAFYLINTYDPFLSQSSFTVLLFNQLLFGLVMGLYAAMAYIGWEGRARIEKQSQLHLIDAFWRRRFFFRETGDGLLRGYAFGGVLLGAFAALLYVAGMVFYQNDSQFGFAEAAMKPKLLTINMSAWVNTWLVALGHVGVAVGFVRRVIKSKIWFYIAASLAAGFLFAGSAVMVAIDVPIWYDVLIFIVMAPAIIYTFDKAGLLSFSTGWWVFMVVLLVTPYWASPAMDVAYIGWVQGFVVLLPLLYGFVAYKYGGSVSEIGGYIPEYQERMANHLRVEKEIEIARESQFKLMPLQPPVAPGVDVYGFFLPSFEVGGDYFDYVLSTNGAAEPEALVMTVADVSGKAMKAAMHAVFTSGLLLSRLHRDEPASILREVAPTLYYRTDPKTSITCLIARYRLKDRMLSLANAGHCLPVLKRNGKAEFIRTPDPKYPLGLKPRVHYEAVEMELQPGDFLLMYSDGLPEAVNEEGARFGYENLPGLVEELAVDGKTSNEIAMEIKRRVQKFSNYQLADDTTIICLRVEG